MTERATRYDHGSNLARPRVAGIPYMRIESNVRFSKHQVLEWLRERSLQPRPVRRDGAKRQ
jgi:hypothetical protein